MAFIGNTPTTQAFTPAVDYFSGNGSTTAFTLSRPVASVVQVQVVIDNVAQNPSSAYTISGSTITFTSAPLSGTNNIYVYYTSPITQVIAPGQGTVTATSFVSSTGTGAGVFQTSPTITTPTIDTITSAASTALTLKSAGTTAVTIDTSQNVLVGQTTNTNNVRFALAGSAGSANDFMINSNASYSEIQCFNSKPLYINRQGNNVILCAGGDNVLVGTTTPYSGTVSNFTASTGVDIGSNSTATSKQLQFIRNGTTGTAGNIYATAGSFSNYCGVEFVIENVGGGSQAGYLKFNTTASATSNERMRITSGDNIRIGMQNYNAQPSASNYGVSLNNTNAGCNFFAGANGTQTHLIFGNLNGVVGSIQTNGSSTAFNTSSDYRLKEDVQPMTGALAKVARLKPVTYKWKVDGSDGEGFIAHELKEVCPHAVNGEKDELDENGDIKPQGMDASFLIATLTAAIQELKALVDAQATEIAELKAKVGV